MSVFWVPWLLLVLVLLEWGGALLLGGFILWLGWRAWRRYGPAHR